jgi:hypothetical protein
MLGERLVATGMIVVGAVCALALVVAFNARVAARYRLFAALNAYRGHRLELVGVLAGSIMVQVIRILQAWLLGLSLGITADLRVYFALIPLVLLVMLVAPLPNGIGSSQAAFWWAFQRAGVSEAEAFALSVLFVALGIVGNLPGAALYASGFGREMRETPR